MGAFSSAFGEEGRGTSRGPRQPEAEWLAGISEIGPSATSLDVRYLIAFGGIVAFSSAFGEEGRGTSRGRGSLKQSG
jgi:hypothetical protein